MSKKSQEAERSLERQIKSLVSQLAERGVSVRRELLARGAAFRVKSGQCYLAGEKLLFVDKRLPPDQQLNLLQELAHQELVS